MFERKFTDEQLVECIRSYTEEHGYPPTLREIAVGLGVASFPNIGHRIQLLEERGLVERTPNVARGVRILG